MVKYSKIVSFVMGGLVMLVCQNIAFDFPDVTWPGRLILLLVMFMVFLFVAFISLAMVLIEEQKRKKVISSISHMCNYVSELRIDPFVVFDLQNMDNMIYENLVVAERKLLDFLTQPGPFVRDNGKTGAEV